MRQAAALSGAAAFCLPRCLLVQSGGAQTWRARMVQGVSPVMRMPMLHRDDQLPRPHRVIQPGVMLPWWLMGL